MQPGRYAEAEPLLNRSCAIREAKILSITATFLIHFSTWVHCITSLVNIVKPKLCLVDLSSSARRCSVDQIRMLRRCKTSSLSFIVIKVSTTKRCH